MSQQMEGVYRENEEEQQKQQQQKQQQQIETDNKCERILNKPYNNVENMNFTELYDVIKEKSQWLKYKYNNNNNNNSTFKDQIDIIKRLIDNLKKPNMFFFNDKQKYNNAKQYIFDDINLNQIFSSVDGAVKSNQKGGLKHKTNKNRKKKQKNKKTKSTRRRR